MHTGRAIHAKRLPYASVRSCVGRRPARAQTHLKPQPPRTWSRTSSVETAASAAAATGWPSRDTASSGHEPEPQRPHPLVTAVAAVLLAVRDASSRAAAGTRGAGRRLARLQVWLGKPEALLFREGCQLLACLMFILLYVWSTYSPVVHGSGRWWLDLVLSLLFAADYVHRTLTSSRHPMLAALHPLALIDLLSFVPSLLGALLPEFIAPWGWDLRWFRVFRALRLLRLSLLSGNLTTMKTNRGVLIAGNLNVPLVWLVASVVAWMFTSASCVAVMEKLPWHDALYFVGSTLTTVGYGDVVVRSSMGRLFVLVMMLVGVVLIPVRASQLYSRLSERLLVAGHKPGAAPGCAGGYVVLSGRLSDVRGFNDFLTDWLVQVRHVAAWSAAQGEGRQGLQLVCLCNKPSVEFLALQELHESHLTLVEGSAFSEHDLLHRAGLPGSLGAMVLADRFSSNATAEDTDVQFRVWAIKSAVKRLPLYVQVLRRSSVDVISPFLDPYLDVIMSAEGTRMRLLALSSLVPGASTLVANLLRSSGPNAGFAGGPRHRSGGSSAGRRAPWASSTGSMSDGSGSFGSTDSQDESPIGLGWQKLQAAVRSLDDVMVAQAYSKLPGSSSSSSRQGAAASAGAQRVAMLAGRRWLREYADGAHCELFTVPAGPPLAGLRFTDAALAVYEASSVVVVGVVEPGSQRMMLNPSSHTIHQEQQLVVLAPTHKQAQAAAAGAGVEEVLFSQALAAAQEEVAGAAAAAMAAHQAEAQQLQGGLNTPLQPPQQQQQQGRLVTNRQADAQQQQQQGQASHSQLPSVAAGASERAGGSWATSSDSSHAAGSENGSSKSSSSNGSNSGSSSDHSLADGRLHGATSSMDGSSRSVTVRVPESLASELAKGNSSAAGSGGSHIQQQQQRQFAEQQPQLHPWQAPSQQHQQQQQPAAPAVAGAIFAEGMHYADAYAEFELQHSQKVAAAAAAAEGASITGAAPQGQGVYDDGGDDLVSECLAPWSGAFESDSLDETELCTDSEMLEAALLQRQRQQAAAERLLQQQQQEQQQWLLMSSFDSSSTFNQQQGAGNSSMAGSPQLGMFSGDRLGRSASPSRAQPAPATPSPLPPAASGISVTSTTAAALDQQIQQQQEPAVAGSQPAVHLQQQQQQPKEAVQAHAHGPELPTPPSQLHGHFILAGCGSSFVPFARQLAASASPAAEPLTLVLLHPEHPGAAVTAIRRMGVTVHCVSGRSSDAAALLAAGAQTARSLVFLGPSERPTNLPVLAVSGVYGDPTSTTQAAHADVGSSRTAVLADADALSSCYGVGEVFLPDSLSTIVELGFTSSIRFLQPGLLLHGRPAPHSTGSVDEGPSGVEFPGSQLLGNMLSGLSLGLGKLTGSGSNKGSSGSSGGSSGGGSPTSSRGSMDGGHKQQGGVQSHPLTADAFLSTGSPAASRPSTPRQQQQQQDVQQLKQQPQHQGVRPKQQQEQQQMRQRQRRQRREEDRQQQQQERLAWPWRQQLQQQRPLSRLPRSSWRHRKEIEEAGQLEGLTEWQLNSYYAAGRVMVPALLDIFTCQGFFKRQALLDLLTELAGDDGRPGGAMLQQKPVPSHLVGCCYNELVSHYLGHPAPLQRYVPLGLLRKKAENRAWRLPYVATHPHPDTVLQATDLVFVIRPQ